MKFSEIARWRLANQLITGSRCVHPREVVATLGAMQAQDYGGALWSIGLRLPEATEKIVEQAIAERTVVRTWPMRGTLHFVAADDVRWMLALLTPRVIAASASRARELELDAKVLARCEKLLVRALRGGRQLTREALMALLEADGISTGSQRGYHILWRLAQEGLLCFGARLGKQQTFALLEEWLPPGRTLAGESALAELARRYFTSHGPATVADFAWWAGLKMSDARAALEAVAGELENVTAEGTGYWLPRGLKDLPMETTAHLLPGFDEYLLGYKDRSAVLAAEHAEKIVPGSNGIFLPTVVLDGRVAGTWKRVVKKAALGLSHAAFKPLKKKELHALAGPAGRLGSFLGLPAKWEAVGAKKQSVEA